MTHFVAWSHRSMLAPVPDISTVVTNGQHVHYIVTDRVIDTIGVMLEYKPAHEVIAIGKAVRETGDEINGREHFMLEVQLRLSYFSQRTSYALPPSPASPQERCSTGTPSERLEPGAEFFSCQALRVATCKFIVPCPGFSQP